MRKGQPNLTNLLPKARRLRLKTNLPQRKRTKQTKNVKGNDNPEQHMEQSSHSSKQQPKDTRAHAIPIQKIKRLRKRRPCRATCQDHRFILRRIREPEQPQNDQSNQSADQIEANFCLSNRFITNQLPIVPGQKSRRNINLPFFLGEIDVWNRSYLSGLSRAMNQQNLLNSKQYPEQDICIQQHPPVPSIDGELKCHHCNEMLFSKFEYIKHVKSQEHERNWNNSKVLDEIKTIIEDINFTKSKQNKKIKKKANKLVKKSRKQTKLIKLIEKQKKSAKKLNKFENKIKLKKSKRLKKIKNSKQKLQNHTNK